MLRKMLMVCLLVSVLWCRQSAPARAQEAIPTTKEAWIEKLSSLNSQNGISYQTIQQFISQDPELTYSVLRDGWSKVKDVNVRSQIFSLLLQGNGSFVVNGVERNPFKVNPHLLDIMAIALERAQASGPDNGPGAQRNYEKLQIQQEILGITFREISSPEEFKQWRASAGNRPVAEVIRENSRLVVTELENGSVDQRLKALELLRKITYWTGISTSSINGVTTRSYMASGLMKIRRDALLEVKLPAILGKLLHPDNPEKVRQQSVRVLARFRPNDDVLRLYEGDLRRELPPLLEQGATMPDRNNPIRQPENLAELLTAFTGDWAVDLIVKLVEKNANSNTVDYTIINALQSSQNPRIIPVLIGLVDSVDTVNMGYNPYENSLRQIAQIGWNGSGREPIHDGLWWRVWWHDNKKRYPAEVQKLPIPHFHKTGKTVAESPPSLASRRRVERLYISEDPKRSYWLLSPGAAGPMPLTDAEKAAIANSGLKKLAAVKPDRPGLIVVLTDGDTLDGAQVDTWLDACDALGRRYFIAVAIRPQWTEKTADRWLTLRDRSEAPAAAFTTEAFVEQIVRQMQSNADLDADRIFLAAEGKAGTAAYACALQQSTAFRGFCLLSSPFRSSLLPPLPLAKNRRFFLALGIEGKGGTDTLAAAAQPILKQQGAVVEAETIKTGSTVEGIQHGVRWLER